MSYISSSDLTTRFGSAELLALADHDGNGYVDVDVSNAAIGDACDEIDTYLRSRYTIPLSSPTDAVKSAACDIARFKLFHDSPPEIVRTRYLRAIEWLKEIQDGNATLDSTEATATLSSVAVLSPTRTFTSDLLETVC